MKFNVFVVLLIVCSTVAFCQSGPGGVGNTTSTPSQPQNVLWLSANFGISQTSGAVTRWNDRSGNSNTANAGSVIASRPTWLSPDANFNNLASIDFSGSNKFLEVMDASMLDNTNGLSVFFVMTSSSITGTQGILSKRVSSGVQQSYVFYRNGQTLVSQINGDLASSGNILSASTTPVIVANVYNGANANPRIIQFVNGSPSPTATGSGQTAIADNNSSLFIGAFDATSPQSLTGKIGEVIIYNQTLNLAQRKIVENYLSAKYNVPLSSGDFYQGDSSTPIVLNYDSDVIGIGRLSGDSHFQASAAGFSLTAANNSLDTDGEILMAGSKSSPNTVISAPHLSLPSTVEQAWSKSWYIDKTTSNSIDVEITFDLSDGISGGAFPGDVNNYVLLSKTHAASTYSIVPVVQKTITFGDKITFKVLNSSLVDDQVYTLGSVNMNISPVAGKNNRTWYSYRTGNWNDPLCWTLDAGLLPGYTNPASEVPGPMDNVVIGNGMSITMISPADNNRQLNAIDVNGTLDVAGTSGVNFTTIKGRGRIKMSGNSGVDNFPAGTNTDFVDPLIGGTVEFYGTGITLDKSRTFNNVDVNLSSGMVALTRDYRINGTLNIQRGQWKINDNASINPLTLNIAGNLNIEQTGEIRVGLGNVRHQLNLMGNLINNGGDVQFANRSMPVYGTESIDGIVDVNFINGTKNQEVVCNGPTRFYRIEIDKGLDDNYILSVSASSPQNFSLVGYANEDHTGSPAQLLVNNNAVGLLRGTLEVKQNVDIPVLGNMGSYTISSAARLWINGGSISKNSGSAIAVYGKIVVTSGSLSSSVYGGINLTNGSLEVHGGELRANQIVTSSPNTGSFAYLQTGGTVIVDGDGSGGTIPDFGGFSITYPGNGFTMGGGILLIKGVQPGKDNNRSGIFINSDAANTSITGGSVIAEISNLNVYRIASRVPFWNLVLRNTTGVHSTIQLNSAVSGASAAEVTMTEQPLKIHNDFTIEDRVTFDPGANDVSIAGDFSISSSGVYSASSNRTLINGSGESKLSFANSGGPLMINTLIIQKQNVTDEVGLVESIFPTQITSLLSLERGIFNHRSFTVSCQGKAHIAGVVRSSTSSGKILFNGSSSQYLESNKAVIHSIDINNSNGVSLTGGDLIVTSDILLTNGVFNISTNKLTVYGPINGSSFSTTKMVKMAGNNSDGGLELLVNTNGNTFFPVGTGANGADRYTPVTASLSMVSDDGYVKVNVVDTVLPTVLQPVVNDVLTYYWRIGHRNFSSLPMVSYIFKGSDGDDTDGGLTPTGFHATWVPGKVLDESPFIRSYESTSDITLNHVIRFDGNGSGFTLENANYTVGVPSRFVGIPKVFYNLTNTERLWTDPSKWSHSGHTGTAGSDFPGPGDVVFMKNLGGTSSNSWVIMNTSTSVASVIFDSSAPGWLPRITIPETQSVNLGYVKGTGEVCLRVTAASQASIGNSDMGDFAGQPGSFFIYRVETNSPTPVILPNTPTTYPNLRIEGNNGLITERIVQNTIPLTINYDLLVNYASTFRTGADVTIKQDLRLGDLGGNGGRLELGGSTSNTITVARHIVLSNHANSRLNVLNTTPASLIHTLKVGQDINQFMGAIDLYNGLGVNNNAILELNSEFSGVYNNSTANVLDLYKIVVDKGNDVDSSFTFRDRFDYATTSATQKPVTIKNGLLVFDNSGINVVLSQDDGGFTIPSTAGLELKGSSVTSIRGDNTGLYLEGLLKLNGGAMNLSGGVSNGNNFIEYGASGNARLEIYAGGNLTVGSQIRRSASTPLGTLKYYQSGGTVIIGQLAAPTSNRGVFEIVNAGSSFTHTAGSLTLVRSNGSTSVPSLLLEPETALLQGSSIIIGNASTPAGQIFGIAATCPLGNIFIRNGITARIHKYPLVVKGDLTVNTGSSFESLGFDLTIGGNFFRWGNYLPNGNTTTFSTASTFTQASPAIIDAGGNIDFFNFTKTGTGYLRLSSTASRPITVLNDFQLREGTFDDNGQPVNLKGDAIIDATHKSTATGTGLNFSSTVTQQLRRSTPGVGTIGSITIGNVGGLTIPDGMGYDFVINNNLRLQQGGFRIGKSLITLTDGATIVAVSPFSSTNMIRTNGSINDNGVTKIFPANTVTDFVFPFGNIYYTPARLVFSSIGYSSGDTRASMNIKPVNEVNPVVQEDIESGACTVQITDRSNVLNQYWSVKSQDVGNNFRSDLILTYDQNQVLGSYETSYVPTQVLSSSQMVNKFLSSDINVAANTVKFSFSGLQDNGITGYYLAGYSCAIPDAIPVYYTVGSGAGTGSVGGNIYSVTVPTGVPSGAFVVIRSGDHVTVDVNSLDLYGITIQANATLEILNTTEHKLGEVTGTGTLKITQTDPAVSVTLPSGNYSSFFDCTGGTLEYGGNINYYILSGVTRLRNLLLSGSGERILSNNDLEVCDQVTVSGSIFRNPYNRNITAQEITINSGSFFSGVDNIISVQNDLIINGGTFDGESGGAKLIDGNIQIVGGIFNVGSGGYVSLAGDLSYSGGIFKGGTGNSRFVFNGVTGQTVSGNFNGSSSFHRLEINSAGLSTLNNSITCQTELLLTKGVFAIDPGHSLLLQDECSVTPLKGRIDSYVAGKVSRRIKQNESFVFPIGKAVQWRPTSIINPTVGGNIWNVEYMLGSAEAEPLVGAGNLMPASSIISSVSNGEYWKVEHEGVSNSAFVGISWGALSNIAADKSSREAMEVMAWNDATSRWDNYDGANFVFGHTQTSGYFESGFKIPFSARIITLGSSEIANPLPVELVYFKGENRGAENILFWKVASEINCEKFELQHSEANLNFVTIATLSGRGTTPIDTVYSVSHTNFQEGKNYYRLKQVDFDGTEIFFNIILLDVKNTPGIDFTISPNPVTNGKFNLNLFKLNDMPVQVRVLSSLGTVVVERFIKLGFYQEYIEFDMTRFERGTYFVEVTQQRFRKVKKIIVL